MFPIQTICVSIVLVIAYFVIRNIGTSNGDLQTRTVQRRAALAQAKLYLAPYSDIWRNIRLSNKFCSLRLGRDGSTISARETTGQERSFMVVKSNVHSVDDLWNMLCVAFDYNTTFDGLVQMCDTFDVVINIIGEKVKRDTVKTEQNYQQQSLKPKSASERLDVNNASEVELTALPGVSIVMAKKLVKKREEIGGFKTVDDVCLFLRLKPHMQNQLRTLICVNKMENSGKIKRNVERSIDL